MSAMLVNTNYWSTVLSFLAQQYFMESHATCILWHASFDIQLQTTSPLAVLILDPLKWSDYEDDNINYELKREKFKKNGIVYNDWILQLTVAIEQSHCESFIAFQDHIPKFAHYFYNASIYSIWRSTKNRFIFVHTDELLEQSTNSASFFNGFLFYDQPNVMLVTAQYMNASVFEIRTNRYVGTRYNGLDTVTPIFDTINLYDAQLKKIIWNSGLDAFDKLEDLKGREVVLGVFDYKPFMLLNYLKHPKAYDRSTKKSQALVDGTEVRVLLTFCELHNCTVQIDTSGYFQILAGNNIQFSHTYQQIALHTGEESEWGDVYANATGVGVLGMVLNRTIDYGIGGMYYWYDAYQLMDMTSFQGRSGITCLVPAPERLVNWALPLRPFHCTLWLCVMLCLALECLCLATTRHNERCPSSKSWKQSIHFGVVTTLKLFVNQSTRYVATSYALRMILLASYIVDIILTTVYGGGLASILTLPKLKEAADSRQRLYEHKLIWTGTSHAWIRTFDDGNMDPVLLGIVENYRINDAESIATMSVSEQMGFVVERMQFGHLANAELIPDDALYRLKLMVDDIYFAYTVAYVPRLWPYLNVHNDFILMWHSSGFDKYWEWKIPAEFMNAHRQNRIAASEKPNLDIGPVKLCIEHFIGLILLWCFGMTCSLIAFLGELCCIRIDRV